MGAAPRHFPLTSWTLLVEARDGGENAADAFEEIARRYEEPAFAYIAAIIQRKAVVAHDLVEVEANSLKEQFFQHKIYNGYLLERYQRAQAPFRSYLKRALHNYVMDWLRQVPRTLHVAPDDHLWDEINRHEDSPSRIFNREWARALVKSAMAEVEQICQTRGQQMHFNLFQRYYLFQSETRPSWEELGDIYGLSQQRARERADTVIRHFRSILRQKLGLEMDSVELVDEELSSLIALF